MKRVLVTGMSGTGKSSLLHKLAARGYRTADTDYGGYFQTTGGERLWREDRVSALLSSAPMSSRACSSSRARPATRSCSTPASTTSCCSAHRPRSWPDGWPREPPTPTGKDPAELAETLQYQQTVEPLLRASATLEVVTTVPVARVAGIVLDHVLGTKPAEQS